MNQHLTSILPLISFRILFGGLMCFGMLRFMYYGWIERLYIEPQFFFKFYGFEWVQPLGENGMYALFILAAISAFGVMIGAFYRMAIVLFFLSFTYIELIDASNYLNHYYLVCIFAFLLIFLPAHRDFSIDVWRKPNTKRAKVPVWTIYILIVQLTIVYTCAGIAKLNSDWLFRAMPLAIWLPEHRDLPIIGYFFQFKWAAYLFSWGGAFYDLTIAYFLMYAPTRKWAYIAVIGFHIMTKILFNIGLFPLIMIFSTLIFFPAEVHYQFLRKLGYKQSYSPNTPASANTIFIKNKLHQGIIASFILLQILLPFRHHLYEGNVLWTEEGYRFSWRVMLVEKIGQATFYIKDPKTNRQTEIINGQYLTLFQEKQMSIQPDFILQFAHFLKKEYQQYHGIENPIVTVDAYAALNGRTSKRLIDPSVNLATKQHDLRAKDWIIKD